MLVIHLIILPPIYPGMIKRTGKPWSGVRSLPLYMYAIITSWEGSNYQRTQIQMSSNEFY